MTNIQSFQTDVAVAQPQEFSSNGHDKMVLVGTDSGRKPKNVALLSDWCYVEHSLMRLLAAWGRYIADWDDKVALHRHLWEQSECVQILRNRLSEFPGTTGNRDTPVSRRLESLVNTVLLAPSFEDAIDGIYGVLNSALTTAYLSYGGLAHPVHDAPTLAALRHILGFKNGMRGWLREYRTRHPHTMDAEYRAAIARELEACDELQAAQSVESGEAAAPCGVNTDFRQPLRPVPPTGATFVGDMGPFVRVDFSRSIETRRLWWCIAYAYEMTLAEEMLRWVWAAHFMPWEYQKELARHLWDESRHGDSGHSRLRDFGISLADVGYPPSRLDPRGPWNEKGELELAPAMTPQELFDQAFFIGMVAETGHFHVKNEAYQDFKDGGDLESAEMMIFDVIDEGSHVRYCHEWLPELAQRAGVDLGDYRSRGAEERASCQAAADAKTEACRELPRDDSNPDYLRYQRFLQIMRDKKPLSNAQACPPRSTQPMG